MRARVLLPPPHSPATIPLLHFPFHFSETKNTARHCHSAQTSLPQQFEPTVPPSPNSVHSEPPRRTANPFEVPPMTPRPSPSHSASSPSSTVDLHVERLLQSTSSSSHCLVRS